MIKNTLVYMGTLAIILGLNGCGDTTITDKNETVHFSYDKSKEAGPQHWGDLKSEWSTCKNGLDITAVISGEKHQSPIDFYDALPVDGNFTLDYNKSITFKVKNNGHAIQFDAQEDQNASLTIGTKKYTLKQFHFHSKSEHREHGEHAKIEGHFVNVADDGSLAVLGVFIDDNNASTSSELEKAFALDFPEEDHTGDTVVINPSQILPTGKVYSYSGSLTTPPCTEGVTWNVYTTHLHLSTDKIKEFTKHYTHNYRPITGTY